MSCYPDLKDFIKVFATYYMRTTEDGSVLTVEKDELQTLSYCLVEGIVGWVESARSGIEGDRPAIGEFLYYFFDQYPRVSGVGATFNMTDEEMYGLGMFLARVFVGWCLKLDQDRGCSIGFSDVIGRQRSGAPGPLSQRLMVRALL